MKNCLLVLAAFVPFTSGCVSNADGTEGKLGQKGTKAFVATGGDIAGLALANLNGMACNTNSVGGSAFFSSCTGNGGSPEYWCSDFARWVWANSGVDTSELTAAAGSFYLYGQRHGTLSLTPSVGAAVVFDSDGGGYADHVAIVTQVNSDGTIESASGDWNGNSGSEAYFSSTSHVALNTAYGSRVGSTPGVIGMTISGYITPDGSVASAPAPGPGPTGGGDDPTCDVHDDGKLYCGNVAGAEIYAATNSESGVVDYLRSNPSWFDCWSTGEMHDGGNTTWYHTEGDDYGQTGWTPAVNLNTSSDFDANPTAQGLQPCT
jgi:hypothetical protein